MIRVFMSIFSGWLLFVAQYSSAENIVIAEHKTQQLISAALAQTQENITYNGAYFKVNYPMGDVPAQ